MRELLLPAVGIVIVATILVAINEFAETTLIKDYALMLIIAGMLFGVLLAKLSDRSKNEK